VSETLTGKIAFVGAGNMAQALIRGLVAGGQVAAEQISASDPSAQQRQACAERFGIRSCACNRDAVQDAAVVVVAVKPQVIGTVLDDLRAALPGGATVISIAAGVSIAAIEARLEARARVVRSMPNVCALVGEGATALVAGTHATADDLARAQVLFDAVGLTVVLDESLIDSVTGLSGSGPAYVFVIIEALSDAGVKVGLPRPVAQRLAGQTVLGAAKLVMHSDDHPAELKDMVCSPGGTTIAGVHALESAGLRAALFSAVEAAVTRARELGADKA
jgi:pyrroline-5-carboxylate reductase